MENKSYAWLFLLLPFVLRKLMSFSGTGIHSPFWNFLCYAEIFSVLFYFTSFGFMLGQWTKNNRRTEFKEFRDEHLLAVRKMSSECWEKSLKVNNDMVEVKAKLELTEKNVRYFQHLLEKEREKATKTATDANKEAMASVAEA